MAVSIDFSGKRGVVFGVANQRSIAWAISERLIEAGAELAFHVPQRTPTWSRRKSHIRSRRPHPHRMRRYR